MPPSEEESGNAGLPADLKRAILVVLLGMVMVFLDSTIINVALRTLSVSLHSALPSIQWVIASYLLALSAAIPITGWAARRFGAKRLYVLSIALFTIASTACGLTSSLRELILFRVLQGLAGGFVTSIGQMILARKTDPKLMAKVMSATGIPTILAPIVGPTIGGLLLIHAGWRWIFFVNLPVGIIATLLSVVLLSRDEPEEAGRLDFAGLVIATVGCVAITYGLAEIGTTGHITSTRVVGSLAVGVVLMAVFVFRTLRIPHPLVDLRLYKNRVYAAASVTNITMGLAIFGATILMPLYFQIVRHEDAIATGLLLMPQGIGTAIAMLLGAKLIDRFGSGLTSLAGGVISILATIPFILVQAHTSYFLLGVAMVIRGFGIGACAMPAITAAYRAVLPSEMNDATVQLGILSRVGGSAGAALFAVVLQTRLDHARSLSGEAAAFGSTFWWVLGVAVIATLPAILLTRTERKTA